jgi:hypothetical protein
MGVGSRIIVGIVIWSGLLLSLPVRQTPQETLAPVLSAMRRTDPSIQFVAVLARVPGAGDTDLVLVDGSPKSERIRSAAGSFDWSPSDTLSLISEERSGSRNTRIVKSFRHNSNGCCAIRVLRATAMEFVISREGEKSEIRSNLKLWIDSNAGTVTSTEYLPFSIQNVRIESGLPVFIAGDGNQFLAIRSTNVAPFLQLMPGPAAAPSRTAATVPSALFGARSPALPQSTYSDFADARPGRVAEGFRKENTVIRETIGPVQIVGMRAWFGKTFDDRDGRSGVGAFGYLDQSDGKFHMFSPPEIRDWSVSAIRVEGEVVWLGLSSKGEWGDSAGGLLRVDLQTMKVQKYDNDGVVNDFARVEDRLYVATSAGIGIVLPDDSIERVFVDMAADRTWLLAIATPGLK